MAENEPGYRDQLARELKGTSKEERRDILNSAKKTDEYWQTRGDFLHQRQEEVPIDDGFGVHIKSKTLYHGSATPGIKQLGIAGEDTIGKGVYLTSEPIKGLGYGRRSASETKEPENKNKPTIYETTIRDIKLADLRKQENVDRLLPGFKEFLKQQINKLDTKTTSGYWQREAIIKNSLPAFDLKIGPGSLKLLTYNCTGFFTDYVRNLGYDGLIAFEGGEGYEVDGEWQNIGDHDSYVIFDPDKVKVIGEHPINMK